MFSKERDSLTVEEITETESRLSPEDQQIVQISSWLSKRSLLDNIKNVSEVNYMHNTQRIMKVKNNTISSIGTNTFQLTKATGDTPSITFSFHGNSCVLFATRYSKNESNHTAATIYLEF